MSPRRLLVATLLGSTLFSASASADTLRDALVSAYETNPSLTAARDGQKATNEGVPLAKANGRPDVTVQPTYFENIMQDGGSSVTQARGVNINGTVSAPLYAGGGIRNAIRAAENRVEAGFANLRGTESAIFSAVVGAYMDVIRDESIVELNRAQVGVLSVNLEATRDRFEIGDLTRTDVAQSEARLALATSDVARRCARRSRQR